MPGIGTSMWYLAGLPHTTEDCTLDCTGPVLRNTLQFLRSSHNSYFPLDNTLYNYRGRVDREDIAALTLSRVEYFTLESE